MNAAAAPSFAEALALSAALIGVLLLPGVAALGLTRHPARGYERLALAAGVSVALWPVALLWASVAGVRWTASGVRLVVAALAVGVAMDVGRRLRRGAGARASGDATAWALTAVLGIAAALRISHVRGLAAPPWVDGYHHTLITQLVLEGGAVPTGFRPFLPIDRFYYHFGFHSLAAAVAWLSGAPAPMAVLWTGQALNVIAVLTVFVLVMRLVRHRPASVLAAAVPASLFWFPSYYASWGRYTQLAGLVTLPVAWLLVADATERRSPRIVALAALTSAGLLLVHYRVFVFFLAGVAVIAVCTLRTPGERTARLGRLVATGAVGGVLVLPWLVTHLAAGARALAATSTAWFGGPDGFAAVPDWLFTVGLNALCIALAVRGVAVALAMRRRAALACLACVALTVAAVDPVWLGVPSSWTLPPFALAISSFLPVAVGIGFLGDAGIDLIIPRLGARTSATVVATLAVLLTLWGARVTRSVINPSTIIVTEADLKAVAWVRANTEADAGFLVSTAHWYLGTYRGLDGGYWLPILTGRRTNIPASFYNYGDPAYAREITATAEIAARGDALDDDALDALLERVDAQYVYVGPAAVGTAGKLTAERLRRHPRLVEVYARDGVHIFRRQADHVVGVSMLRPAVSEYTR